MCEFGMGLVCFTHKWLADNNGHCAVVISLPWCQSQWHNSFCHTISWILQPQMHASCWTHFYHNNRKPIKHLRSSDMALWCTTLDHFKAVQLLWKDIITWIQMAKKVQVRTTSLVSQSATISSALKRKLEKWFPVRWRVRPCPCFLIQKECVRLAHRLVQQCYSHNTSLWWWSRSSFCRWISLFTGLQPSSWSIVMVWAP